MGGLGSGWVGVRLMLRSTFGGWVCLSPDLTIPISRLISGWVRLRLLGLALGFERIGG